MKRVLFVCSGNVMRSQIAEAYYNTFTKSRDAMSAGIDPTTPHRYTTLPEAARAVMNEEGIDISSQKVKYITETMVSEASAIYVLTDRDVPDFLKQARNLTYWNIPDPSGGKIETFREARNLIREHIEQILTQ